MAEQTLESAVAALPPVPLTLEGSCVLHQMVRVRWTLWRALTLSEQHHALHQARELFESMETSDASTSAVFSMIGHKADLMFVHMRPSFEELKEVELRIARLALSDFLEVTHSYVSVVELGLYESTAKVYQSLAQKGIVPHSPEWKAAITEVLERQGEAMHPRLFPEMPGHKYICFYPMDRRRGEQKNWYEVPFDERQRMMHEHGLIGRRYAGEVRQIISGSIGLDDWEWGVDLFADDPVIFKRLIYEMRFDEVSAVYALFGTFYLGIRCWAKDLDKAFYGDRPAEAPKPMEA